jgi:hypothetical protein
LRVPFGAFNKPVFPLDSHPTKGTRTVCATSAEE